MSIEKLQLKLSTDSERSLAAREERLQEQERHMVAREEQLRTSQVRVESDQKEIRRLMSTMHERAEQMGVEMTTSESHLSSQLQLLVSKLDVCGTMHAQQQVQGTELRKKQEIELARSISRCEADTDAVRRREAALHQAQQKWNEQRTVEQHEAEALRMSAMQEKQEAAALKKEAEKEMKSIQRQKEELKDLEADKKALQVIDL